MDKMKLTVKVKPEDMFAFQMYHTYAGIGGIMLMFLVAFAIVDLIVSFHAMPMWTKLLCFFVIAWVLILNPLSLKSKSRRQVERMEFFRNPIDVEISEEGLGIYQNGEGGVVAWKDITKIVILKKVVVFYMGKVRAHLLPLEDDKAQADAVVDQIRASAKGTRILGGGKRKK